MKTFLKPLTTQEETFYLRKCRQGDKVDGEANYAQHGECTNQSHRNGDGRDEGGAEVLQEDVYHEEHEHEGFDQGAQHVVN